MKFNDSVLEQMRRELDNPELMKQRIEREKEADAFIKATREKFIAEGRDFDKEFQEWKNK